MNGGAVALDEPLLAKVRRIPDFPKPGILFYDVTTLLKDAEGLREVVDRMAAPWLDTPPDYVLGIDARGFLLASAVAYRLGVGVVLARKKGKLPWRTERAAYALEYGEAELEIHVDAVEPGRNVLIADDLLATGGTAEAACRLVERTGGTVAGLSFVIELDGLPGRERLQGRRVESLLRVPA